MVREKTIGRLSLYRRLLTELQGEGPKSVYSHQLAARAGVSAAQIRRDFMILGYSGSPAQGYEVAKLLDSITHFLDAPESQGAILVGVGNLGRALLAYFGTGRARLRIEAACDNDPKKIQRVIHGCHCYAMVEMPEVIRRQSIRTAIITVPAPEAQAVANDLIEAGIRGILNFAPVRLHVPEGVFVENMDMAVALEKVAFFARQHV
ncbi:MAG: redox-sensing transcriptional repressor Rex [Sedimentisphaerales bacterium]|nr:redox-sensing transcriptional repressor Rex [Sedimentisphaerales bacterium]